MKLLVVASFISIFLFSCTKKKGIDFGLDVKETLRVNITTEPPTLDWIKSTDSTSAIIQDNIMEGLVQYNFADPELSLKPALALKWEPSENSRKWLITLRKDVKWNDGVEFTAQHVIDGWQRLLAPATASSYAYFLFGLKNAEQFNSGKIKDFSQVGAKVNAQGQIEVELESSQSYFPYLLTHHCTYPVRMDVIKKHGDRWTEPGNIVTLGAYNLKSWKHDVAIVMERNEGYFGSKAKTKNILAYMVTEESTGITMFETGTLDVQRELPSAELSILKKKHKESFVQYGLLYTYYYGFNTKKPPMDNPDLRKAISHAIDRNEITTMLDGGQKPISGWLPPGMFGYNQPTGLKFNVGKAKEFLAKAGIKDAATLPKIELAYNTNEDHKRIAENIQAQLKRNLGITVEIKNEEWKSYLNKLKSDTPHIYRMGWVADYPDPDNFLNLMTSYSANNYSKWGDKEFDSIIKQAVSINEKPKRKALYVEAQRILTEKFAPVVPLYAGVRSSLVSTRVKNYPVNVMDRMKFKEVELK